MRPEDDNIKYEIVESGIVLVSRILCKKKHWRLGRHQIRNILQLNCCVQIKFSFRFSVQLQSCVSLAEVGFCRKSLTYSKIVFIFIFWIILLLQNPKNEHFQFGLLTCWVSNEYVMLLRENKKKKKNWWEIRFRCCLRSKNDIYWSYGIDSNRMRTLYRLYFIILTRRKCK